MNTVEELLRKIDYATEPRVMSKEQAIEVYEEIIEGLRSRIEALGEEIKNEPAP